MKIRLTYSFTLRTSFFVVLAIFSTATISIAQEFVRVDEMVGLGSVTSSNGVAVADFDRDGDLDVFVVGYRSFQYQNPDTWNRLFENKGNNSFEDITIKAGLDNQFVNTGIKAERGEKMGASWGDYDSDGFPDLFLTNSRGDRLYHNEGDGTFRDVTNVAGVMGCNDCYSSSSLWWDFDGDKDLDLYVSRINGYNVMYENVDGRVFRDVTNELGLAGAGITWTSVPIDVNNDGLLDLYVVNDTQMNQLFLNSGKRKFEEVTGWYSVGDRGAGMGVTIGDYNNDGRFDIYVTNIYNHLPNPLYTALVSDDFRNDAKRLGVENTGWGWGTHFFDYDNDGDEDIYSVSGIEENQYIFNEVQRDEENVFFKNTLIEDREGFVDWSKQSGTNILERGRGLEVFDFDDDGDLDILIGNSQSKLMLFRNETVNDKQPATNSWLKITLQGTTSNINAIGTRVKVVTNNNTYYRWHHGAGFLCQSIKPVHVGLGSAGSIQEIVIKWPSGLTEKVLNVAVNQNLLIKEGVNIPVSDSLISGPGQDNTEDFAINYPNPFIISTNFRCKAVSSEVAEIKIFSPSGVEVFRRRITSAGGELLFTWDGMNHRGVSLPPGIYYFNIHVRGKVFRGTTLKLGKN